MVRDTLVQIAAAYALVAIIPGSNFLVASQLSLRATRSHGAMAALGVALGAALLAGTAFMSAATIATVAGHLWILDIVFAGLTAWLGIRAMMRVSNRQESQVSAATRVGSFRLGLTSAISNPTTAAFLLALGASFGRGAADAFDPIAGSLWIFAIAALWFGTVAVGFGSARVRALYVRWRRGADAVAGFALLAISARTLARLFG